MISRIYIGVDISKDWFDACTSLDDKSAVQRYPNNAKGHTKFIADVSPLASKLHVCMEYTGGYETPLALACRGANLVVSIIDGGKFSLYRKSFGRAKSKTDQQDARLLARYASERKPPEWFPAPDEYRTLRELVRHRQNLLQAKAAWGSRSAYTVESEMVTAQRLTLRQIVGLQIVELDKAIASHIKSHPSLKETLDLLISIPGIAKVTSARILAETGPISNYKSARQYSLVAGLSPIVLHSGQKTPPGKLPVYGNAELRCALYMPVISCMSHKKGVWPFMQRVSNNGEKVKMTVITAGMRKLAHIIYGVLSTKTKYDENKV